MLIAPAEAYHGTGKLLRDICVPWGLQVAFVDMTDLNAVNGGHQPQTQNDLGGDAIESRS